MELNKNINECYYNLIENYNICMKENNINELLLKNSLIFNYKALLNFIKYEDLKINLLDINNLINIKAIFNFNTYYYYISNDLLKLD